MLFLVITKLSTLFYSQKLNFENQNDISKKNVWN